MRLSRIRGGSAAAAAFVALNALPALAQNEPDLLALAVQAPSAAPSDIKEEKGEYRISPGDKVRVSVFAENELTGDHIVGQDGGVRLPMIGRVEAVGLTLAQFEQKVAKTLNNGFLRNATVSASISEFRPLHMIGYVRVPGTYPFREGMSVLAAIAQAGGIGVPETQQGALIGELLQSEERVRMLETNRFGLLARRARLIALQTEAKEPTFSGIPAEYLDASRVKQIIEGEKRAFESERESQRQEIELLRAQIPRLQSEISSLNAQKETEERQRVLNGELLNDYDKLMKTGLTRKPAYIEVKREEARIEGNLSRLTAERLRAELALGEVEFKIGELRNNYRRRLIAELQEVERALLELSITLPSAMRARSLRAQQFDVSNDKPSGTPAVTVIRASNAQTNRFEVAMDFELQPGDIVQVGSLMPPAGLGSPSIGRQSVNMGRVRPIGGAQEDLQAREVPHE